ncbi:Carbonic anhydrase, alpha-class, conserved site [Phytophthora cactorum]|nr:Carbonic anhydrase, alpha-class, conserved site [Phytophthora cactorum]
MIGPVSRALLLGAALIVAGQAGTNKWGYKETTEEELGPADWKESYRRSPINIPVRKLSHNDWGMAHAPLKYGGDCSKFTIKKLEDLYKWEINGDEHCTFHMHATSEHALDDYHYDAEIHFVHKAMEENAFVKNLWKDLETEESTFNLKDAGYVKKTAVF